MNNFLTNINGKIAEASGKPVKLRGFNLGGWLLMEGFLIGGRNIPEYQFLNSVYSHFGRQKGNLLLENFWQNFISESDIANIANYGFNCVRIPFHYKLFTASPLMNARVYLHRVISYCKKHGIYCILDMHAAPGSQNADWHSDSKGKALFWENKRHRNQAISIWEEIADTYKDEPAVAGYNILNEPVTGKKEILKRFYLDCMQAIRAIDRNHLLFLDGNFWSTDFSFLDNSFSRDTVLSPHFYNPLDYSFSFVPELRYPGRIMGEYWNKAKLKIILKRYYNLGKKFNLPVMIGEFGINITFSPSDPKAVWLKDVIRLFNEFGLHWQLWTYKSVYNYTLPSGLFGYLENHPWIKRDGPLFGWENYINLKPDELTQLYESWKTKHYSLNKNLLNILQENSK